MTAVLAVALLLGGCSQVDGNKGGDGAGAGSEGVPVRSEAAVKQRVARASGQILDVIGLKDRAKAKDSMPVPLGCSDHPEGSGVQRVNHLWSLWGPTEAELEGAMDRLKEKLPASGWSIAGEGLDDSRAKSPRIVAESDDGQVAADLRLRIAAPGGKHGSAIEVSVATKCFRAGPAG
ncbi:hypothetical protein [Streptomyces sp. NPDC014894]|uniref:hypothetical protein n=1 Tax=Streptomyces sp. NPDC014894 TaxID=3364931 RepID=UPI0036FBB3BA